ncbi:MAG: ribonuclease R [Acidobacteria bacterium]|nr:ribonuclease R [Acidobacteriota bacterium]MBV9476064.1 ribonuclease R [Acidobacteriota bacterium]
MARSLSVPERPALQQSIVDLLRQRGSRLLTIKDIAERLEDADATREQVERAVEELEQDGVILAVRGKRYSLLEFTPYHAGSIRVHPDGHGTILGGPDSDDIYIDRRSMKGAMNGDLVVVRVDKQRPSFKKLRDRRYIVGEVTQVLRRAHRTVVGRFHLEPEPYVVPFDVRIDTDILIEEDATYDAREGEMVNVEIDRYPDRSSHLATGRVVEVLGFIGDPGVDIEVVVRKHHIPHNFPQEVLDAADAIPSEVPQDIIAQRVDLRERHIVTIDGETAKDFDDAVEVQLLPNGNYLLGVHIADVAHYVTEGSELDKEAFERGTSVYFPGRAIPMLPERLSNGICSLNPQIERLTFSCEIEIDGRGRFVDRKVYKSVIRTKERMTYTNVNAILVARGLAPSSGAERDRAAEANGAELLERYGYLIPDFERMFALYEILRVRRDQRGSIDFDLPEAEVMLGESGDIEAIRPTERNVAHRLIEEFMLAANEVVARELVFANQPGLYRVHQQPDPQKLADLKDILKEFKLTLRGNLEDIRPGELQRVLKSVAGTPEERFLTNIILRSMKRAFYSEENIGHFALGLEHYCHFTSPIRRYPDLIVHRRLAELIESGPLYGERREQIERAHPLYALQSSERERRAEEAEREVLEWKKVIFMRDKVGEEYTGIVTGVAPFGLFVELDEIFVQGMVPVATIGGDFWIYADREHRMRGESTNRELRLGDHVRIRVESIDEDRHQLEFRLLEVSGQPIKERER